jgi:hypothetical protein
MENEHCKVRMGIIDWDTAFDTTETKQLPDHFLKRRPGKTNGGRLRRTAMNSSRWTPS